MPTHLHIRRAYIADARLVAFMQAHLADMHRVSPPESVHALDIQAFEQPDVELWAGWVGDDPDTVTLAATAALKRLDATHAEVKSMRTAETHRGQGMAQRMLTHLIERAHKQGFERLSLETGTQRFFEPACALYAKYGFEDCGPFGDYEVDPHSRFMTLVL